MSDKDKMLRITHLVKIFNEDAYGGMSPHPDNVEAMAGSTLQKIRRIIHEDESTLDIIKPTASEVKQMIDDATDELKKEMERIRAAAILHHQNYHSGNYSSPSSL